MVWPIGSWPAVVRQRLADQSNVRRINGVALVKYSSANQRNSKRLKISGSGNTEVGASGTLFLLEQLFEILLTLRDFILRHQQK